MRIFEHAKFPFLAWRRRAYLVTALLLLVGFGAMIANVLNPNIGSWLRYGVDFTGGSIVQVEFRQPTTVDRIRDVAGDRGWEIYEYGSPSEYLIRTAAFTQDTRMDAGETVTQALSSGFDPGSFSVVRTEAVGPKVGAELQQKALLAIVLSLLATLIYLAIRFEWRFGVAAVVATTHDMLITLGFLAVLRSEISLGSVAALLTVIGYSLNDTIVVFDRIRENLAKPRRGQSYMDTLNRSINETLPRTVLTGGSTLGTLLALLVFGGPVIRDFAMVLMLGIVIGTFSSIFVAAPVLNAIETRWPHRGDKAKSASAARRRESAAV